MIASPEDVDMILDQQKIEKIERFLEKIEKETYPEPPAEPHLSITRKMFDHVNTKHAIPQGSKILDVGCGQGLALELFTQKGFQPTGIALNAEDVMVCRKKGYNVHQMDQSFLAFDDESFGFIWCRHCIEHSIFPYFTLSELFRTLKPEGYLYLEVPAPDTSCRHQTNENHYSVLGKSMWIELIKRTGFVFYEAVDISFDVPAGPDMYWAFIQQKEGSKR